MGVPPLRMAGDEACDMVVGIPAKLAAVTGLAAAALAAASIFYTNIGETSMADEALTHARQLFNLANTWRSDSGYASIPRISEVYKYIKYLKSIVP